MKMKGNMQLKSKDAPGASFTVEKGGPGSGHFGHAGRPGKRGGSLPGGGAWNNIDFQALIGSMESADMGVSGARFVTLEDGTEVVYKEQKGNMVFNRGTSATAEEAAYVVARDFMGEPDLVPKSVALDDKRSVQQRMAEGNVAFNVYKDTPVDHDQFKKMVILDMVVGNGDRHLGNIWINKDNTVTAIDNDHGFSSKSWTRGLFSSRYNDYDPTTDPFGTLVNGSDAYYMITGGSYLEWRPSDFSIAGDLLADTSFRDYVTTKFGAESWSNTEARLNGMLEYANTIDTVELMP